jgi:hypothetical protein
MRKLYFSVLLLCAGVMAFGQAVNINVQKTATAPAIDGDEEALWEMASAQPVNLPFGAVGAKEAPTVPGSYWKALWCDSTLFVLINVQDDNFWDAEESGGNDYEYDKTEVYMDVNDTINTAVGPMTANSGTWQFAPNFLAADEGIAVWKDGWDQHSPDAYIGRTLYGEAYIVEYRLPAKSFYNKNLDTLTGFALGNKFGFDITIIDQDENVTTARQRAVWQSAVDEAWATMASCGTITLVAENSVINYGTETISAYPNPVVDVYTIDAKFNKAIISNTLGQSVMVLDQLKSNQLSLATLPKGVYFISVYQDANRIGMTRFIKQ